MKRPSKKQLAARKKFARAAKLRSKLAKAKKRKNPHYFEARKGKSVKKTTAYLSKKEVADRADKKKKILNKMISARGMKHRKPKVLKKLVKQSRQFIKATDALLKANEGREAKSLDEMRKLKSEGYKITHKKVKFGKSKKAKKAKKAKKIAKKGKGKIVAKKRKHKKAAHKRKRKSAKRGRVIVLKRKGQSVRIKRNPDFGRLLSQYTGLEAKEIGALAVGGAIYGTVNALAQKYLPQVYTMAASVPVLGTTVVPFALGVGIKLLGKQIKQPIIETLGEGLVGAAVVGMGINAAQYVPGLHGVEFFPSKSDMNGVEYFPNKSDMSGADFGVIPAGLGMQPQMGGADFGMQPQMGDGADFGVIPEGLN